MKEMGSVLDSLLYTCPPPLFINGVGWVPFQKTYCYTRSIIVYTIGNKFTLYIVYRNNITILNITFQRFYSTRKYPGMQLPGSLVFAFIKDYFRSEERRVGKECI